MYAWKVKAEDAISDFDIAKDEDGQSKIEEMYYWRNHHDLHGWMENLYRQKGGEKDSFNCVPVRLTEEDLFELEQDVRRKNLPETTGFFFGSQDYDEYYFQDLEYTKKVIEDILSSDLLKNGWYLEYHSSW